MNKERERKAGYRYVNVGIAVFLNVLMISGMLSGCAGRTGSTGDEPSESGILSVTEAAPDGVTEPAEDNREDQFEEEAVPVFVSPFRNDASVTFDKEYYDAEHGVLFDADTGEILAYRDENVQMYPASLTKVMTLIVAAENISDLSDTVTITEDMVFPMIEVDASRVGFEPGDTPTLEDVLYGIILASGADASLAAADYIAGSEEGFVELMNLKAQEMGLKRTHFTNSVGLHDKQHYSTAAEMGAILAYAIQDETCRRILSTGKYVTAPTASHPEGIEIESTLFSRMYGNEMPGAVIRGGKTGYTDEAHCCIESFAEANGRTYILVLTGSTTKWNAVYNTLSAFSEYCTGGERYDPSANDRSEKNTAVSAAN